LVRRLGDAGFVDGTVPTGSAGTMATLMDRFLDAAAAMPVGGGDPPVE